MMMLFAVKSLARSGVLEQPSEDYRKAVRVRQYRVSGEALYFPAFPGTQYLAFQALSQVKVRNTSLNVTGTCGKTVPMICLRAFYDGEFYKDFLFEKQGEVERVLEQIRLRCPELAQDVLLAPHTV